LKLAINKKLLTIILSFIYNIISRNGSRQNTKKLYQYFIRLGNKWHWEHSVIIQEELQFFGFSENRKAMWQASECLILTFAFCNLHFAIAARLSCPSEDLLPRLDFGKQFGLAHYVLNVSRSLQVGNIMNTRCSNI
jgi:hypothetical protein